MTEFTDYQISVDMAKQICMRDWRLELNSQSGFQGCVSTVFSIKWTILEVIVKNDKNSKGGRQQQIYMIYFGSFKTILFLLTQQSISALLAAQKKASNGQTIDMLKGENTVLLEDVDYNTCHPN